MEFIDLKTQYKKYKTEIDEKIKNIIDAASFIMGKENKELESTLANYVGAKHAIGCASGTDALLLGLTALGVKPGDEIITTPFTFIATVETISFIGAKPVFVDIDENNYNLNIDQIESKITPKTKGIVAVSLYGQIPDMDRINSIAKKNDLFVIEDGAQSFGSIYKGRKSCSLSDIGTASFFPAKPLGCFGDGGMAFTNNDSLAEMMRCLANHGQSERYIHKYIGLNMRLDNLQAGVLLVKFAHFEEEAQKRVEIGKKYTDKLKGLDVITPYLEDHTDRSVFAQYSVRVNDRDKVVKYMKDSGIPIAVHYPIPVHLQQAYKYLGYKKGDFPVSEKISDEIMSLPMHPFLTDEQIDEVVNKLKDVV